jgi:hypothetical protein
MVSMAEVNIQHNSDLRGIGPGEKVAPINVAPVVSIKPSPDLTSDQIDAIHREAKPPMDRREIPTDQEADRIIAKYKKFGVKLSDEEEQQIRSGLLVRTGGGAAYPERFGAPDVGAELDWIQFALSDLEKGKEIYYTGGLEGLSETSVQGVVVLSKAAMGANLTEDQSTEIERHYQARVWLHNMFREMDRAEKVAEIVPYTSQFEPWMFNVLFRLPGVAEAFRQYEVHGNEFVTARGETEVTAIRHNIRHHIEAIGVPPANTFGYRGGRNSFTSAQAEEIARRLFRVTQREAWYWGTQTLHGFDNAHVEHRLGDPAITTYEQRFPRNSMYRDGMTFTDVSGRPFDPYPAFDHLNAGEARRLTLRAFSMFRALPNWNFKPPDRKLINPHIIYGAFMMGQGLGHIPRESLWNQRFDYQLCDVFSRKRTHFLEGIHAQFGNIPPGFEDFTAPRINVFGVPEDHNATGADFDRVIKGSIPTLEHVPFENIDFTFVTRADPEGSAEWFRGHWRDQRTAEAGLDDPLGAFLSSPRPETYAQIDHVSLYADDSQGVHEKILRALFEVNDSTIPLNILDPIAQSPGKVDSNWSPINPSEKMAFLALVLSKRRIGREATKRLEGGIMGRAFGGVDRVFDHHFSDALVTSAMRLLGLGKH